MKRLLSFLVITGILVFAGYKVAAWYLADQQLAGARAALSDYGVVERGRIGSRLDGTLVLEQAAWQDFRLTQPLTVDQLAFDTGSPATLLGFLFDPQGLPDTWQITAEGVSLTLEPAMFRNWLEAQPATRSGVEPEKPPLLALACGPDARQQPGSGDLLRMGIDALAGDLILNQTPEALSLELNAGALGSLEARWPGGRINGPDLRQLAESSSEPVAVVLRDAGLMRKLSAYCVRETGMTREQWLASAARALGTGLEARGYQPSAQLLALYRQWLSEGGELAFRLQPGAEAFGMSVRESGVEQGESWPVSWNGQRVPDVFLTEIQPPEPALQPPVPEPVIPRQAPAQVSRWSVEPVESAANWQGRQVRVTLNNGNQVEGRLDRISERELEIARLVDGGEVAYPILKRAINRFEVWRRGRPGE